MLAKANAHFGLLEHDHLTAEGVLRGAIATRVAHGRLTRVHERVYAWGHTALREEGRWLAALWTAGPDAVLSHTSAAAYYGWRQAEPGEDVHITTTRGLHDREGIRFHQCKPVERVDLFRPKPFVITHGSRTIVDCADVLTWAEYRSLVDALPNLNLRKLREAQKRTPGRRGANSVNRLIEADDAHTKSEFERRFLRFSRQHQLIRPSHLNAYRAGHKADCVYEEQKLVIELDGRAYHRRRNQMRKDRQRDSDYQLAGYRILRLVWDDLHPDEAHATATKIRKMLALG